MQRFKDSIPKLSYTLDLNHQRDWFIKALLALSRTPLMQLKIGTLQDALEKESWIEAMAGHLHEYRGGTSLQDLSIMGLQNQIKTLTEKMNDLQPIRLARPNVWCTHYMVEGHVMIDCPRLQGINHPRGVVGSSGAPPTTRVSVIGAQGAFLGRNSQDFC